MRAEYMSLSFSKIAHPLFFFLLCAVTSWTRSVESYTLAAASVARLHVHTYFFCPASRVCLQADLLGDRIAIMSEGKLRCVGSSLFLKSHYGIGYNLTLVKASKKCRTEQVSKMVMFFCPEAKVLSTAGGEMSYRLPWSSVSQFPGLFAQLEERRHHMGIGGYGVSMTTLEEVFMRCAQLENSREKRQLKHQADVEDESGHHPFAALEEGRRSRKASGAGLGSRPGSRKVSNATVLSPPRKNTASSGSGSNGSEPLRPGDSSLNSNDSPSTPSADGGAGNFPGGIDAFLPVPRMRATLSGQFVASFQKRYICAMRDLSGRFFEVVLPVLVVALVLLILKLNTPALTVDMLMKAEMYSGNGIYSPMWYTESTAARSEPGTMYALGHARGIPPDSPDAIFTLLPQTYSDSTIMTDALLDSYTTHTGARYGAMIFNDSIYTHFNYSVYYPNVLFVDHPALTVMHNTTFFHCLPVLLAEVAQARWNANRWRFGNASEAPTSQVVYQLHNHPLPLTTTDSLRTKTYLTLFAALFILIPFCYLPASFVLFVVKERSVKSKHLQFVSGLNPNVYWLATYAWDMINYFFVALSVIVVMLAFSNEQFTGTFSAFAATFLLFFQYGLAAIPLSYCYSFCFGNYTSAQVGIAGLNFLTGFVLVIGSFMLDNIGSSTESLNGSLKAFYRVFPSFTLGEGLINLATRDFFALIHGTPKPSPFDWDVAGRSLTYLIIEAGVFMLFTLLLESNFVHRAVRTLFNYSADAKLNEGPEIVKEEDEDVARERARVQKLRVRILKQTSEGGFSFAGLSSPVTPGYGLRSAKNGASASGSNGRNGGDEEDGWGISLTSHGGGPSRVVSSPHRFSYDLSGSSGGGKSSSPPAGGKASSGGNQLEAPLLSPEEREEALQPGLSSLKVPSATDGVHGRERSGSAASRVPPVDLTAVAPPPPMERGESAETVSELPSHLGGRSSPLDRLDGSLDAEQEDILVIQHLRKVYPARGGGKVTCAVDNLSLGIPRGQVFGFLGINGQCRESPVRERTHQDLAVS
jgi:hypothetical protein